MRMTRDEWLTPEEYIKKLEEEKEKSEWSKEERILELFKKELEDLMNKYRMNDITWKPSSELAELVYELIALITH